MTPESVMPCVADSCSQLLQRMAQQSIPFRKVSLISLQMAPMLIKNFFSSEVHLYTFHNWHLLFRRDCLTSYTTASPDIQLFQRAQRLGKLCSCPLHNQPTCLPSSATTLHGLTTSCSCLAAVIVKTQACHIPLESSRSDLQDDIFKIRVPLILGQRRPCLRECAQLRIFPYFC